MRQKSRQNYASKVGHRVLPLQDGVASAEAPPLPSKGGETTLDAPGEAPQAGAPDAPEK